MSNIHFPSSPPSPSVNVSPVNDSFNSTIMVAAMVILFVVVLFVVSLHIYAKWFWRQGVPASRWSTARALNASWRQRLHRLESVTDDSMVANTSIGLDPSAVNSLPSFIYEGAMHEAEPLLECAVCLSEFQVHDKGRILPNCKHSFHIDCIDMWFHSHATCPLCRTPVLSPMAHEQHAGNLSNHLPPSHNNEQHTSATQAVGHPNSLLQNTAAYADPREPLPLRPSMAGHPQEEEGLANSAGVAPTLHTVIPLAPASSPHIPSNGEYLRKDDNAHAGLPRMGADVSSSSRSMSTETLRLQERAAIRRSTSLSLSRSVSEDVQASSPQPQKSSSFRMSIKWLVSRELSKGRSRVFPSAQAHTEAEQNTSNMNLPV